MKTTRPGLPFDSISDLSDGMEIQADGEWTMYEPWSIMTVQQSEDGQLFVDDKAGKPVFLNDLSAEQPGPEGHDFVGGLFYVPLGEVAESFFDIVDDKLAMVDADSNPVLPHQPPIPTDH